MPRGRGAPNANQVVAPPPFLTDPKWDLKQFQSAEHHSKPGRNAHTNKADDGDGGGGVSAPQSMGLLEELTASPSKHPKPAATAAQFIWFDDNGVPILQNAGKGFVPSKAKGLTDDAEDDYPTRKSRVRRNLAPTLDAKLIAPEVAAAVPWLEEVVSTKANERKAKHEQQQALLRSSNPIIPQPTPPPANLQAQAGGGGFLPPLGASKAANAAVAQPFQAPPANVSSIPGGMGPYTVTTSPTHPPQPLYPNPAAGGFAFLPPSAYPAGPVPLQPPYPAAPLTALQPSSVMYVGGYPYFVSPFPVPPQSGYPVANAAITNPTDPNRPVRPFPAPPPYGTSSRPDLDPHPPPNAKPPPMVLKGGKWQRQQPAPPQQPQPVAQQPVPPPTLIPMVPGAPHMYPPYPTVIPAVQPLLSPVQLAALPPDPSKAFMSSWLDQRSTFIPPKVSSINPDYSADAPGGDGATTTTEENVAAWIPKIAPHDADGPSTAQAEMQSAKAKQPRLKQPKPKPKKPKEKVGDVVRAIDLEREEREAMQRARADADDAQRQAKQREQQRKEEQKARLLEQKKAEQHRKIQEKREKDLEKRARLEEIARLAEEERKAKFRRKKKPNASQPVNVDPPAKLTKASSGGTPTKSAENIAALAQPIKHRPLSAPMHPSPTSKHTLQQPILTDSPKPLPYEYPATHNNAIPSSTSVQVQAANVPTSSRKRPAWGEGGGGGGVEKSMDSRSVFVFPDSNEAFGVSESVVPPQPMPAPAPMPSMRARHSHSHTSPPQPASDGGTPAMTQRSTGREDDEIPRRQEKVKNAYTAIEDMPAIARKNIDFATVAE